MKNLSVFFVLALLNVVAFAQGTGNVRGVIKDATGPLPGASVTVKGTLNGTISDYNGSFRLTNVTSGTQTIVISFIGYESKELSVQIEAGKTAAMGDILVKSDSEDIDEVIVQSSYRPSQMRALSMQKMSPRIENVIASDAIGKLPDRNAAEAVQRVPGVSIERDHGEGRYVVVRGTPTKWNANLINGDRLPASDGTSNDSGGDRAVPLDIFPTEMIQYVKVSKAITPDMEGDAIGGSVNFITRTAPYERTLNVAAAGGYNDQAAAGSYNASLSYGDRFFNGKLGVMAAAAIWNRNWGTDNYEVTYNAESEDAVNQYAINEYELRDYLGQRRTFGGNLGAEYVFNDNHKLYARGIYSDFNDDEMAREHTYNFAEGTTTLRTRHGIMNINLFGGELGGEHGLGSQFDLDWKLSSYTNEMTTGDLPKSSDDKGYAMAMFTQRGVQFDNLSDDGYKYLADDAPAGVTGDAYDNIQPYQSASTPFMAEASILEQMLLYQMTSKETDYTGQMNLKWNVNDQLNIKVGTKLRNKQRESGITYNIYIPGALLGMPDLAYPTLAGFEREAMPLNGGFLTELGGNYDGLMHDQITMDQLDQLFSKDVQDQYGFYQMTMDETSAATAAGNYRGTENVAAYYFMGDYQLNDKISFVAGMRHEITMVNYKGNSLDLDAGTVEAVDKSNTTHALLPMAHMKISPNNKTNIRLAYTRTFARPDFSKLNPGSLIDETNRYISEGNPDLQGTFSNNFDLLGEYFFDNVGVVSGGVFYKQITNDIFTSSSYQTIDGSIYIVERPENIESAWLAGLELGLSKRFDFLPGFLSGFGFEGNYTFTQSEANVPSYSFNASGEIEETITKQSLPSQANHIFNASLFYEKYGLLLRAAANYKGNYIVSFSEYGAEHNRWYDKNLTVDLSAAYTITPKLRVFAEVNNLTNAPLRYYHGNTNRPEQVEYYSIRGQVGVRFSVF